MTERLVMYSLATCPTCVAAREEMRAAGTEYEERVVDAEPRWRAEVLRLTGQRTVPVFVLGDKVVVGFHGETG
jgi:glutaredoxin 3